jgi:hypothetical protein
MVETSPVMGAGLLSREKLMELDALIRADVDCHVDEEDEEDSRAGGWMLR